jgi:hypothetical protein
MQDRYYNRSSDSRGLSVSDTVDKILASIPLVLTIASMLIAIWVMAGQGFGAGVPGIKKAFFTACGLGAAAVAMTLVSNNLPYPLLLAVFLSGAFMVFAKETGASGTAQIVAKVLVGISVLASMYILATLVLAMIFLNLLVAGLAGAFADTK